MSKLLSHIADYWHFLWSDGRYRIIDSINDPRFPGSLIIVASDRLAIRFVNDRDVLMLEFREVNAPRKAYWHSVDLVQQLLGEEPSGVGLEPYDADFVERRLADIEAAFSVNSLMDTKQRLSSLAKAREKRRRG